LVSFSYFPDTTPPTAWSFVTTTPSTLATGFWTTHIEDGNTSSILTTHITGCWAPPLSYLIRVNIIKFNGVIMLPCFPIPILPPGHRGNFGRRSLCILEMCTAVSARGWPNPPISVEKQKHVLAFVFIHGVTPHGVSSQFVQTKMCSVANSNRTRSRNLATWRCWECSCRCHCSSCGCSFSCCRILALSSLPFIGCDTYLSWITNIWVTLTNFLDNSTST